MRKKHNIAAVIDYWCAHMEDIPNNAAHQVGWEKPFCFACELAFEGTWKQAREQLELAHLKDFVVSGDDNVSDVLPLCHDCHRRMPPFDSRDEALAWVDSPARRKERFVRPSKSIGQRTSMALQRLKAQGVRMGPPRALSDELRQRIVNERKAGKTMAAIAEGLDAEGVPPVRGGKRWYPATIKAALVSAELDGVI